MENWSGYHKNEVFILNERKEETTRQFLLYIPKRGYEPFIVCSNFTIKEDKTVEWDWGHYCSTLIDALDIQYNNNLNGVNTSFVYTRLRNADLEYTENLERDSLVETFETGNELYSNLFYKKYSHINLIDILSHYIYNLENKIAPEEVQEIRKDIAKEIKRDLIG